MGETQLPPNVTITAPVRTVETGTAGRSTAAESPAFRALLESLERVAKTAPPAEPADPASLQRAIADADDGFREVMDLRRKLEDAFRQRLP